MSATKTKRTDLNSLVKKYQRYSVVNEIEQNLLGHSQSEIRIEELHLSSLFSEDNYDLSYYKSLEESLTKDGFIMPLIVVKENDGYEIINGVKRFLLAKKIGYKELPVVKAELDKERKYAYILENIQAEGDSALVKSYAFQMLKEKYQYSDETLAKLSSYSIAQVRNLLRLKELPSFVKDGLKNFTLSYSEARSLLNLPEEKQKELFDRIIEKGVSVRDLEKEKRSFSGNKRKTSVKQKKKQIIITFESEEEAKKNLKRIYRLFAD